MKLSWHHRNQSIMCFHSKCNDFWMIFNFTMAKCFSSLTRSENIEGKFSHDAAHITKKNCINQIIANRLEIMPCASRKACAHMHSDQSSLAERALLLVKFR